MALDDHALTISMRPTSPARSSKALARVTAASVAIAALASGLILPLAVAGPLGIVGMLVLVAVELGGTRTGSALAAYTAWRARESRREAREGMLVTAGCAREPLVELDRLVRAIEQRDSELVRRLDLEALLDRHVALTIAYERALRAALMTDRGQLERIRDGHRADPDHDPRRLELCERRIRCHDQCEATMQSLADELAVVADVIRLVAQRVACPDELPADDTIERCLGELDDRESARGVITAELRG